MERIKWYFKQLLPLTYVSEYKEDGLDKQTTFKMWLGRCYNERTVYISEIMKWIREKKRRVGKNYIKM